MPNIQNEIVIAISNLKTQLSTLYVLTKDVTDTTDSDSIEFLLSVTDSFVKWSKFLRDDIKILTDSVGK